MDSQQLAPLQQTYIPVIALASATLRHSLRRLEIATIHTPDHVCGMAQRIGYTGGQANDLAIYRLKVKGRNIISSITLPGFYVIENGVFVEYEQWQQAESR
ncbi:MAG: hypothetical protein ACJ788_15860 [Ktedonobacteraceae bacterium]